MNERAILERILAFEYPGAEELRGQLAGIRASRGCECGCATINLAVDRANSQPATDAPTVLPATGTTEDELGSIIVFQRDGWLSCLEIYYAGDDPVAVFPPLQTIGFELDAGETSP